MTQWEDTGKGRCVYFPETKCCAVADGSALEQVAAFDTIATQPGNLYKVCQGLGWGIGMKTIGIERKRPRRLRSCVDWQPRALCRGELTDRQAEDSGRILGSDSEGYKHADFVKLVGYQDDL